MGAWFSKKEDPDSLTEYYKQQAESAKASSATAWKEATKAFHIIKNQTKGLARLNRKIAKLRHIIKVNGINPDNGPTKAQKIEEAYPPHE